MPTRPPQHQRPRPGRPQAKPRGTTAERGYGSRWQRYRLEFLSAHPVCADCWAKGIVTKATDVDHIEAVNGPDDPRFWLASNHAARCHACHSAKTCREDGGFGLPPQVKGDGPP